MVQALGVVLAATRAGFCRPGSPTTRCWSLGWERVDSMRFIFSLSSFSLVLIAGPPRTVGDPLGGPRGGDPCGRGGVREHLRERTRTDGTEPARHPPPEVVQVSAGRDG